MSITWNAIAHCSALTKNGNKCKHKCKVQLSVGENGHIDTVDDKPENWDIKWFGDYYTKDKTLYVKCPQHKNK